MDGEPAAALDLLRGAQALLERPPGPGEAWAERVSRTKAIARELDKHGVDGLSLIRFGMSELFAAPVLGSVAVSIFLESQGKGPLEDVEHLDVLGWRAALRVAPEEPPTPRDLGEVLTHATLMVEGWIASAPVEMLVRLTPPTSEQLSEWAAGLDTATRSAAEVYRWFVERTLESDLDRWSTPSLKHEYRYTVQGDVRHAPEPLLAMAKVQPDRLAHALATRVLREDVEHEQSGWVALLEAVQKQAKMLLRQDRCAEAAALFEFLICRYPGDPSLRNNLAFCLVTSRPAEASEHLRDAQRMGFAPRSLLLYNRTCCATTESLKREVLFDANRHWLESLEPVPVGAFIWRWTDGGFVPTDTADVRVDLARASSGLALELGELERVPHWESRIASLHPAPDLSSAGQ